MEGNMNQQIFSACKIALNDCLGLKKEERLLILIDNKCRSIGQYLFDVATELNDNPILLEIKQLSRDGQEPPEIVSNLMKEMNVVVVPMSKSITHTDARRNACKAGARVATMPGITEDILLRCMNADYNKIKERTEKIVELLSNASMAKITSDLGSDLTIPITQFKPIASTGIILQPGQGGNLPSGEAFMAPDEGKSEGLIIIDGSFAGIGVLSEPIKITVKDGFAIKIEGGSESHNLLEILNKVGKMAFNIAELGIGTNESARISGNILEDEKVMGTAHIALGNNVSMGGSINVPLHMDGIIKKPNLWLDNKLIIDNGNLLI